MPMIYVDDEVFAFLQDAARPFVDTEPNKVLRRLLLKEKATRHQPVARRQTPPGRFDKKAQTEEFVRRVLAARFKGSFRRRDRYQYMFESDEWIVYFQNYNSKNARNLWYRLRRQALQDLLATDKKAQLCLTNPAEGVVYAISVQKIPARMKQAGWDREHLEVNIDPSENRWRELDWDLSSFLERYETPT